ncbi:MAG: family 20 glycosylhydrolase [Puniceicoccales bacterium]|nr:family 20 glycosylhydrolase [Puniceicoccales bacterium]
MPQNSNENARAATGGAGDDAAAAGAVPSGFFSAAKPAFAVRGFMLDISRCKVPTLETLRLLIRQLAALRFNQLQLYTEHTYAFREHEEVWRDASPLTPADYAVIAADCAAAGIELVPNLQSFGHTERWLKHPRYRHLAECPDGFFHELAGTHRPASTLRPCPETLAHTAALYDEFLPNFSSPLFNIGGDEPWELGLGASRDACARAGKRAVYLEHLRALIELAAKRGKRAMFWADVLLEDREPRRKRGAGSGERGDSAGEEGIRDEGKGVRAESAATSQETTLIPYPLSLIPSAALSPRSLSCALPVIWGYDAGHPFDEQCAALEALGCEYYVAPGCSCWQTFHGRLDNAFANITEAVAAAERHHAAGLLLTAWGDNGNHQPWWTLYAPLVHFADLAWNGTGNATGSTTGESAVPPVYGRDAAAGASAVPRVHARDAIAAVFLDGDRALADEILRRGVTDRRFPRQVRNKSALWEMLFGDPESAAATYAAAAAGAAAAATTTAVADIAAATTGAASTASAITALELAAASALEDLALARARALLATGTGTGIAATSTDTAAAFAARAEAAIALYERAWLARARPGGLAESVARIRAALTPPAVR